MEFGLIKKRSVNETEDKYPLNAIIELPKYEENTNSKAIFNKKAYELLGLNEGEENEIAFSTSKSELNKTFLINANNYDSKANIKLRKNGTYSSKNNIKILKERFKTTLEEDLVLEIKETEREFDGQKIFTLEKFVQTEQKIEELTTQSDEI